jgi:hypothetical protein
MSSEIVVVRTLSGDFIQAALVYRWFVTQNATKGGWDVCASIHGPQNPYQVLRQATEELAHTALTNLLIDLAVKMIRPVPLAEPIADLPVTGERGALDL